MFKKLKLYSQYIILYIYNFIIIYKSIYALLYKYTQIKNKK